MEEILNALELKKQLDALRPIDKEHEAIIMQKFRLDWNYHSNHLEGNALTYGETKALILFGVTAQGKTLKDHFEITGHNEAINWVIDMVKGERPLTENFIRELHELLLKESYEVDAITPDGKPTKKRINVGKYKSSPNHVQTKTGEIFHFATPEETPARMTDLLNWYREKSVEKEVNPIFLAAEFHYRFIRIHPFDDGNGRTARILMNFILMQFGFPPVIIKSEDKENYFIALQLADAGNIEAFIEYIAKNLTRSLEIMIAGAKGESVEEPDDLDKEIALLEQKIKNFGNEIKETKSIIKLKDIFDHTIKKLVREIESKLRKFQNYYLVQKIYVHIGNKAFDSSEINQINIDEEFNDIRLFIRCDSLKINGLEDFSFIYEIKFKFDELLYIVYEVNAVIDPLFKKHYENLSDLEIRKILKLVMDKHNARLEIALNKN